MIFQLAILHNYCATGDVTCKAVNKRVRAEPIRLTNSLCNDHHLLLLQRKYSSLAVVESD